MTIKEIILKKNAELNQKFRYEKKTWISVSNIKDSCKEPFDRDGVATKTHKKYFDDATSPYYQMSVEDIINQWETKGRISRENGSLCDTFIEYFYNNESQEKIDQFKQYCLNEKEDMVRKCTGIENCLQDFKAKEFVFDAREIPLLLPYEYKGTTYVINGRFDAIFTKLNKLILIDWKNSEDIKTSNSYQKLLGPCDKMDDCDMNLFTIQLYLYKYMLKNIYGVEKEILPYIIQFPSQKDYYYKVFKPSFEYDEKLIEKIIEHTIKARLEV